MMDAPKNWGVAEVNDVAIVTDYVANGSFAALRENVKYSYTPEYAILIRATDNNKGWCGEYVYVNKHAYNFLSKSKVEAGDVVISSVGEPGQVFRVPNLGKPMTLGPNSILLKPFSEDVEKGFLEYFFKSPIGQNSIESIVRATAQRKFNKTEFRKIRILIAPINEQHRIVAKLEKLLAKVNKCKERLEKIPIILKRFRQSVLMAACSGELTKDWRQDNNKIINLVPSLVEDEIHLLSRRNRDNRRFSKGKFNLVPTEQPEGFTETPNSWIWSTFDRIINPARGISYGVIKLGPDIKDGIPCLRTSDVKPLLINIDSTKKISKNIADKYSRTYLEGGELLVNVRGTLGGVATVPSKLKGYNISREVAMVPILSPLPTDYFCYWVASIQSQNWLTGVTKGVAYTGINLEDLRKLPVALPPLEEQLIIIKRVKDLLDVANTLEQRYNNAKKYIDKLTQSVIAKAFRGELVEQDQNDEPATVLLERIQAERKSKGSQPKKRKRSNKKPPASNKAEKTEKDLNLDVPNPGKMTSTTFPEGSPIEKYTRKDPAKSEEKRFEKFDVLAAFRKAVFRQNDMDEYTLLRQAGKRLGVQRLSRSIRRELASYINTAIRRKIILRNENGYGPATPTIQYYEEDDLVKTLTSVIRKGYEHPRDHLVEEAAKYLGFEAPSDAFRERMKSVFRKAIRSGALYRNGEYVGKAS